MIDPSRPIFRKPRHSPTSAMLRTARRMLLLLIAAAVVWAGGLLWFAHNIPSPEDGALPPTPTDAVVVLTGGSLRLKAGLDLLEAGAAHKLFVSGVSRDVDLGELLHAAQKPASPLACCIALGYDAADTAGNAVETRAWMEHEGFHSLRLVTASYHMQRSLLEFRRAMPEMVIVPHPVFPEGFMRRAWWAWPGTLALIVIEYQKYLFAAARFWIAMEAHKADAPRAANG